MKLSIILPVYNVEQFIPDCLNSLETQDLPKEEYEIICVDDGSPDNSAQVIEEYQNKYSNIRLIRQKNAGVCAARNNGLKLAKGEYVWFIDPDDYIQVNCLGLILNKLQEERADLLVFEYDTVKEEARFDQNIQADIVIESQKGYDSKGSACQYVCRRAYLEAHNIYFNEDLAYGEDYLWAFQVNYRKHVGFMTAAPIYHYRQRAGSAMHSRTKEKQIRHMEDMHRLALIYGEEYKRCEEEGLPKDVLKNIKRRRQLCAQSVILDLIQLAESKQEVKTRLKQMKEEGIYPYAWMWWYLWDKGIQSAFKTRVFSLFFPMKWYVVLMNTLYRKVKKKG